MSKIKKGDDSSMAASLIKESHHVAKEYPTFTRITASFNIMIYLLSLCSVRMKKKLVKKIVDDFHKGLIEHIDKLYEKEGKDRPEL